MRTLVHISDTHILPTADDRLHGVDTLHNLQAVLQHVVDSGTRPDALVVSGDLANGGELESYRRLRHELDTYAERLGSELVVAIGNHDLRPTFRQAMLDGPPTAEPVEYVRWIGGLRLIVLDSSVPGAAYGEVRPQQLAWLASELSTPAAEGSVLVMHHPPVPDPGPLAGLLAVHRANELEAVVRGSDVVAVLAGHAHHAITAAFGGAFCYAAPATAYTVDALQLANCTLRGVQGSGFGLVRVFDGRAVALTVSMPTAGHETYRQELSGEVLQRLNGEATVAA
ncbi:MAG TPA: metallophosphoesterase [Chloroflexota bacterium]|nr:metallophosphoesterase [Chloroflexota bacterium]